MIRFIRHTILCLTVVAFLATGTVAVSAASPKKGAGSTASAKSTTKKGSGSSAKRTSKGASKANSRGNSKSGSKKNTGKKSATPKNETSDDVKKKEAAAQKEIKATERKIELNEKEVASGISLLNELNVSIGVSEKRIADLSQQLAAIDSEIKDLTAQISNDEKKIHSLRAKYVDSVKKMRKARRQNSLLAFLFSSKNFYQAYRRLRYLKEFSRWRDRQVGEIRGEIKKLNASKQELDAMRQTQDRTLSEQRKVKSQLSEQRNRQKQTVEKLQADGEALRAYLARKQNEANQLQSRMAELIAAEQAAAEEAERKRLAEEAEKKRLAEELRLREQREAEEAARKAEEVRKAEQAKKDKEKTRNNTAAPKKEKEKNKSEANDRSYADARGRTARKNGAADGVSKPSPTPATSAGNAKESSTSDFGSMKGRLPRPVSGSFSIVNAFGKHALQDLPDVMYDNPGIDALVKSGEHAKAVYDGTVSGVYMINGFGNVVLVNHGEYFTVYGNLAAPSVSKGQTVRQGQDLGSIATNPDDSSRSTIHFEVWKGRTKLNPSEWIR